MTSMKYVQKTFLKGTFMCAPSFLVCARLTNCVHAQLGGSVFLSVYYNVCEINAACR